MVLPQRQVFVRTVTRLHLGSACLYCYHTGKYLSELLSCWQVPVYTVTKLARMSVVSTFTTLSSICAINLTFFASICLTVTIPAIICLYCYHTGKFMSIVLPHWQVSVLNDATLESICLHCCHIGKCLSVLFTILTSICQQCYHTDKNLSVLLAH